MEKQNYHVDLQVYREVDVVVAGGGTAGVMAAYAAAKNGASTVLLERSCALGGCMTQGLVQSLHSFRLHQGYAGKTPTSDWSTELIIKDNLTMEVFKQLQREGGTAFAKEHYGDPSLRENVDEEVFVHVLDEIMEEAGVDVLFDSYAFDVTKDGDKVTGVIFVNKSGLQLVRGKRVIDCSGDMDLAVKAGAGFEVGDEDGRVSGMSLFMEIGGIDQDRFFAYLRNRPEPTPEEQEAILQEKYRLINGGCKSPDARYAIDGSQRGQFRMEGKKLSWDDVDKAREEGRFIGLGDCLDAEWLQYLREHPYPEIPYMPNTTAPKLMYPRSPRFVWYGLVRNGKVFYDQTMGGVSEIFTDISDAKQLSEALAFGRKINWIQMQFLRERVPGFEDAYIIKTAPMYGGRDTRRLIGEYWMTLDDIETGRWFDDTVVFGGYNNVHLRNGQFGPKFFIEPRRKFGTPYRCMVPKRVENLLVAGRPYSKNTWVRNSGMPICMALGEAAGTAAALTIRDNVLIRDVDIRELQTHMGIDIDELLAGMNS